MMNIVFGAIALIIFIVVAVVVHHECMDDKEREKYGLGPRGQGR